MPDIAGSFARGRAGAGGGQALTDLISFIAELQLEQERLGEQKRHNLAMEETSRIQAEGMASYRDLQSQLLRKEIETEPGAKPPTASETAYARKRMGKYLTDIDEANSRIDQMRLDLNLGSGGQPKTPGGIGRRKEQESLDNWNKFHRDRAKAQSSLDSLRQASAKKGIDLEFGAPTMPSSEEVLNMSEDELLQTIGAGIR